MPQELNWEHWNPVPSVSPCYTLVCSVLASHNTDPLAHGGSPCHHVHPWAPRGAQRLSQALLMPCPARCWMQPGREPVVVTWLWGRPAPWQDPQNPTGSPFGGSRVRPTGCPWAHPLKDAPLQQQVKGVGWGSSISNAKTAFQEGEGAASQAFHLHYTVRGCSILAICHRGH